MTNTGKKNFGPQDANALWDLLRGVRDNLADYRPTFGAPQEHDLRATVLGLLAEGPRNGAQVLRDIEDRTTDDWAPGAGEIYPTLQLLVDEGLATVTEEEGRRTFTLTAAGHDASSGTGNERSSDDGDGEDDEDDNGDWTPPWLAFSKLSRIAGERGELPKAGVKLGQAVRQVVVTGDEDQRSRVADLLDDTRRRIYGILAEDDAPDTSIGSAADRADGSGPTADE